MLNLKALLTKILETITVTSGTMPITTTTGTLKSSSYVKYGPVIHLTIQCTNSSSVAAGSNFYQGTITDTKLAPSTQHIVTGASYYGGTFVGGNIYPTDYSENVRNIYVHNNSTSALTVGSSNAITISFTYFVF